MKRNLCSLSLKSYGKLRVYIKPLKKKEKFYNFQNIFFLEGLEKKIAFEKIQ